MIRYVIIVNILFICTEITSSEESDKWNGNWFPKKPGESDSAINLPAIFSEGISNPPEKRTNSWTGKWFPTKSESSITLNNNIESHVSSPKVLMGVKDPDCDDVQTNLWRDYDPKNISFHSVYICTKNRTIFESSYNNQHLIKEYTIPTEYSALHRCMNESITYDYVIPTFGTHRPNWPVYGEYNYVPVQRWIHTLEHGGIVALYHPCANKRHINKLKDLVKSCLFRHVITAYAKLTPEHPFALVGWGKSLEMSYIDSKIVIAFIRMSALQGPEKTARDGQYNHGLIENASVVSDINDSSLCPNM